MGHEGLISGPEVNKATVSSPKIIDFVRAPHINQGGRSPSPPVFVLWSWVRGALGTRLRAGHGVGWRSLAGSRCVGEGDGECERVVNRGPSAEAGGGHKLSKKKVDLYSDALAPILPLLHNPEVALGLLTGPDPDPQSIGRQAGSGREAGVGTLKRERAGAMPLLSVGHFLFQAPSSRIFGSPMGSPVFMKNLGAVYPGANGSPSGSPE
jgi:hypothetical protein